MANARTAPHLEAGYLDAMLLWSEELYMQAAELQIFWLKLFWLPSCRRQEQACPARVCYISNKDEKNTKLVPQTLEAMEAMNT